MDYLANCDLFGYQGTFADFAQEQGASKLAATIKEVQAKYKKNRVRPCAQGIDERGRIP